MLYLRERKLIALHVACGDITEVSIENGKLLLNVYDATLEGLLKAGKSDIESALRWQGLELEVEICLKEHTRSKAEVDIKRLKEIFEEVEVIDRKHDV